jgi:predicted transcriptional regulator of viral defense system
MFIPDRILRLLAEHPGMTRSAMRAALSDCKRVAVNGAILRLEDKGLIEATGWGRYRLAPTAAVPPIPRRVKSMRDTIDRGDRA